MYKFGGFLLAFGRLCDVFGHKNVLIFGMTLFNISSIVCAAVHNSVGLNIGRAFQGMLNEETQVAPALAHNINLILEDSVLLLLFHPHSQSCPSLSRIVTNETLRLLCGVRQDPLASCKLTIITQSLHDVFTKLELTLKAWDPSLAGSSLHQCLGSG